MNAGREICGSIRKGLQAPISHCAWNSRHYPKGFDRRGIYRRRYEVPLTDVPDTRSFGVRLRS